jgi:hypothetical protein
VLAQMLRIKSDDIDLNIGVFGDPHYCVERIRQLQCEYQVDEFIVYIYQGGITGSERVQHSMRRFAKDVMRFCR